MTMGIGFKGKGEREKMENERERERMRAKGSKRIRELIGRGDRERSEETGTVRE